MQLWYSAAQLQGHSHSWPYVSVVGGDEHVGILNLTMSQVILPMPAQKKSQLVMYSEVNEIIQWRKSSVLHVSLANSYLLELDTYNQINLLARKTLDTIQENSCELYSAPIQSVEMLFLMRKWWVYSRLYIQWPISISFVLRTLPDLSANLAACSKLYNINLKCWSGARPLAFGRLQWIPSSELITCQKNRAYTLQGSTTVLQVFASVGSFWCNHSKDSVHGALILQSQASHWNKTLSKMQLVFCGFQCPEDSSICTGITFPYHPKHQVMSVDETYLLPHDGALAYGFSTADTIFKLQKFLRSRQYLSDFGSPPLWPLYNRSTMEMQIPESIAKHRPPLYVCLL